MNDSALVTRIVDVLRQAESPLRAREIARLLRRQVVDVDHTSVNQLLYGHPQHFNRGDDHRWSLAGDGEGQVPAVPAATAAPTGPTAIPRAAPPAAPGSAAVGTRAAAAVNVVPAPVASHVTVRMAWHDNQWNGTICSDPAGNSYCVGARSLLSDRLARVRRLDVETANQGGPLDARIDDEGYLPPCYWTSGAFAAHGTRIVHRHPFIKLQDTKVIEDNLPPYSVFTWPFRLSMTHGKAAKKRHGSYFRDLDDRIGRYLGRIKSNESIVFFYLNYDNPISGDDGRYAVVGCALVEKVAAGDEFPFTADELVHLRSGDEMQNFPARNWTIKVSYDFERTGVRLPYHEYLRHVAEHPADEGLLGEIRVLVEEPALIPGFKYVSEQLDQDQCLALLYKLRHAFERVDAHAICSADDALARIDTLIALAWLRRGLYPGLPAVLNQLGHLADGDPGEDDVGGTAFVEAIRSTLAPDADLLEAAMTTVRSAQLPPALSAHGKLHRRARRGLADREHLLPLLRKLCLFSLSTRQVGRIICPADDDRVFDRQPPSPGELASNPYLLCESYVPATNSDDLDREQPTDRPIDYFTIDAGMFPDDDHLEPNPVLQDLGPVAPQRLRAFVVESLHAHEDRGHTFASVGVVLDAVTRHPLFHRHRLAVDRTQLLSDVALRHFGERLHVERVEQDHYFYLRETWQAERIVARVINDLMAAADHDVDLSWIDALLDTEVAELRAKIPDLDEELFRTERTALLRGSLTKRFFVITGRPGAGKTRALREVLRRLAQAGEHVVVLAPTGKATLRLREQACWDDVQTIDLWLSRNGLSGYREDRSAVETMTRSASFRDVDAVVIDEMSMVHLPHIALILRALEVHRPGNLKRVILVGDEHQLPPIGCGRPLDDLIAWLRADPARERAHSVRLRTNCRQQYDPTVLDAAYLFAGKNRYSTLLWQSVLGGGQISAGLRVASWRTRDDLEQALHQEIDRLLAEETAASEAGLNRLYGLYDNGFVPEDDARKLTLERGQILTPYRTGLGGSAPLSDSMRRYYRTSRISKWTFVHSDKIILVRNHYGWNPAERKRELRLSNGSIGVLCRTKRGWKAYFPEERWPFDLDDFDDEEDIELAYAITVHKSQGSEFRETFVVIPERRALLSRELIYTALTRSQGKVTVLVQDSRRESPLQVARDRSVLAARNSSIFGHPSESGRAFEPEEGVRVKSKIEFMIHRTLVLARDRGDLAFGYELDRTLTIDGATVPVRPDFTVHVRGKTFYWEHLGMLDREDYAGKWRHRRLGYETDGLGDVLLTTDDLAGVSQARIEQVVRDVIDDRLAGVDEPNFSRHHYTL